MTRPKDGQPKVSQEGKTEVQWEISIEGHMRAAEPQLFLGALIARVTKFGFLGSLTPSDLFRGYGTRIVDYFEDNDVPGKDLMTTLGVELLTEANDIEQKNNDPAYALQKLHSLNEKYNQVIDETGS